MLLFLDLPSLSVAEISEYADAVETWELVESLRSFDVGMASEEDNEESRAGGVFPPENEELPSETPGTFLSTLLKGKDEKNEDDACEN
mmetsp:Transcript_1271/g.1713  ORF Transcript_1271/g.1713 Transcript_1271/m.1713 type:complete len:88 (-) Transcript_1271:40-303(-)